MLDRVRPERVYRSIDWPLLVMFAGLFVVVHAFEANVVKTWGLERWHALLDSPVVMVSGLSVVLSNLVSNVPAVLLFKPLMEVMPQKELAWLALSMSSTLAGNLTILGLGRQPDRRRKRSPRGDRAGVFRVPQGRRSADGFDNTGRRCVAGVGSLLRRGTTPMAELHDPQSDFQERRPSAASIRALDGLNFFLADVRDGMGPFRRRSGLLRRSFHLPWLQSRSDWWGGLSCRDKPAATRRTTTAAMSSRPRLPEAVPTSSVTGRFNLTQGCLPRRRVSVPD